MTAPTMIQTADGNELNVADGVCEGCGQPMAEHSCGAAAGSTGSVTYSRSTGPRKPPAAHPTCPHCGGRVHFNMGGSAINAECLNRQYSLDKGEITDPNGRMPILTLERMGDIFEWGKALSVAPTYGKMESAAGGASTYSGLRVKTGRKTKVKPAAPGVQIQDMAADEEGAVASEAPAKTKRTRKSGSMKVTRVSKVDDGSVISDTVAAEIVNGVAVPVDEIVDDGSEYSMAESAAPEPTSEQDEPVNKAPQESDEETARRERAERRAARKAVLAGKA